jgi:sulfite reductase (NADPH) flavoprotein alpha-component
VQLVVRRMLRPDGSPGIGSGWLCEHAMPGDEIALRLRSNPNFHAPDPGRPMILVGNGTGIAGLRAHLKARQSAGARRNWLLFGERNADRDFFFGAEVRDWQARGFIERLDLAFSRDQEQRIYVQHALQQAAGTLRQWVADGAAIYVCGSLAGMAPAVDVVLRFALGDATIEDMLANGRYRRDVY